MANVIPPYYIDLVSDAALKSFWRHASLHTFLRRCGVPDKILARGGPEETKRQFLPRVFRELEKSDQGLQLIHRIADALVQQKSFPDLDGWEDSTFKKERAREAISTLKQYREEQAEQAQSERERKEARSRADAIKVQILERKQDLNKLSERLTELSKRMGEQKAGYDFQDWFFDLADHFDVVSRRPYTTGGRQIDGSITVDGTTYLVETKFTAGQSGSTDVDSLLAKVTSKADNTMGIMLSVSGYSSTAIGQASHARTPLLLLDHNHIYMLLGGSVTLPEMVMRVRRHSSQTGEAYLPAADF